MGLRYRDVAEPLAERGVIVTDETIRRGCRKFGQTDANERRRRRPRPGDKWHPDEVFVSVNRTQQYRWRAVDRMGMDSLSWCRPGVIRRRRCSSSARC